MGVGDTNLEKCENMKACGAWGISPSDVQFEHCLHLLVYQESCKEVSVGFLYVEYIILLIIY